MTRQAELAKIHIACKQLGIEKCIVPTIPGCCSYHDMLFTVARVRSSADLDDQGRQAVLEHLRSRGATFHRSSNGKRRTTPALDKEALISKIRAILIDCRLSDEYCDAISMRMFGVHRYEFCTPEQLHKIVASLVYAQERIKKREKALSGNRSVSGQEVARDNP